MKWHQHIYYSIKDKDAVWHFGLCPKDKRRDKPQFGFYSDFYDGNHWAFHLGALSFGASFYYRT